MTPSAEELLTIARQYWDSSKNFLLNQEASPERRRLQALWAQERQHMERWWAFLSDLKKALPGFILGNIVTTADASFRCMVYPDSGQAPSGHSWAVVGCVSILAPVYAVYSVEYEYANGKRLDFRTHFEPNLPGMELPARTMATQIEKSFGFSPVPPEVARTPVPLFVEFKEPPHTTLFHALFTSEPESIL